LELQSIFISRAHTKQEAGAIILPWMDLISFRSDPLFCGTIQFDSGFECVECSKPLNKAFILNPPVEKFLVSFNEEQEKSKQTFFVV
jgi:hypothetical protein